MNYLVVCEFLFLLIYIDVELINTVVIYLLSSVYSQANIEYCTYITWIHRLYFVEIYRYRVIQREKFNRVKS